MTQKLWECASGFFGKMVAKIIHQAHTHGYTGWDHEREKYLLEKMNANISRRDWVDVANIAMFLDYHDQQMKPGES